MKIHVKFLSQHAKKHLGAYWGHKCSSAWGVLTECEFKCVWVWAHINCKVFGPDQQLIAKCPVLTVNKVLWPTANGQSIPPEHEPRHPKGWHWLFEPEIAKMVSQADSRQPTFREMLDTFDIRKCNPRRTAAARSNDANRMNWVDIEEAGRD